MCPPPSLHCVYVCVLFVSVPMFVWLFWLCCVLVCVIDTVLLSTTSSLCSRPTTGPPSVSVFPTSTLNSSSLSTTSWSGTVQCSISLPPAPPPSPALPHPHPMEHACVHPLALGPCRGGMVNDEWLDLLVCVGFISFYLFIYFFLFLGWLCAGRCLSESLKSAQGKLLK